MKTTIVPNSGRIVRERVLRGLSKLDVANAAGVPHSSIIRAEEGKGVSPKTATGICNALQMDFDSLFEIVQGEVKL